MSAASAFAANLLADDLDYILRHTEGRWEPLRGQSVFITGGTGFFGRWLLESFAHANRELSLGATAVVLSRDPASFCARAPHLGLDAGIAYVVGDVRSFKAPDIIFQLPVNWPQKYAFLIHAATEASAKLNAENPLLMVDTIVDGTRAALNFAVAAGVQRFLLTSSGAVYGAQPSDLTHLPEDYAGGPDPTKPGAAYGEGKRMAELLCACYGQQFGLECLIARCFAFVGPFLPLDTHFAIGNFIRDAQRGGPIQVNGDGTPRRSYLYAADLAIWLWTILLHGTPLRPYNVGSSRDLQIAQIAETVRQTLDPRLTLEIAQTPRTSAPIARYVPDVRRAQSELGLAEMVDLATAICRTAALP